MRPPNGFEEHPTMVLAGAPAVSPTTPPLGPWGTMVLHETSHAMTSPIPPTTMPPAAISRAGVSTRWSDRVGLRG